MNKAQQETARLVEIMESFEAYVKVSGRQQVRDLRMDKEMIGKVPVYYDKETSTAWRCFRAGALLAGASS